MESSRYGGRGVTLYGKGEAVAVSYSSSTSSRSVYLGKDILGSVRTATADGGAVEDRYEYDAFGQAYKGDLSGGMNLGYTGKPYDAGAGLYNYGYRDYMPQAARFTTVDPIRDGNNWYAYVNNDPVNWVDPWGLAVCAADVQRVLDDILQNHQTTPLSSMVNTGNLANIISNSDNSIYLDHATQVFVNNIDREGVWGLLNQIDVVTGVQKTQEIRDLLEQLNMDPDDVAAVGLGNTIVVFDNVRPMVTNTNGRVTDRDDANLLGHEAIHSLQAAAVGGLENFLNNYFSIASNGVPYLDIPYERAAYNFGPDNPDYTLPRTLSEPILHKYPGWQ